MRARECADDPRLHEKKVWKFASPFFPFLLGVLKSLRAHIFESIKMLRSSTDKQLKAPLSIAMLRILVGSLSTLPNQKP
jgi:hypothetical protein